MRLLRVLHSQDIDHRRYVWEVIRIHTLYVYIEMPHPRLLPVGFRFDGYVILIYAHRLRQ